MRRLVSLGLILISLAACSARELTNVTLIQTIGLDGAGPVELTAVGDEGEAPARYHTRGDTIPLARAALEELGTTRLEVTHVSQLVLGPEVDVPAALWTVATHRESGCAAAVWLTDRPAGEVLSAAADPAGRLTSLRENAGVRAPTVLEALSALEREGRVTLPVVELRGEDLAGGGSRTIVKEEVP